MGLLQKRKNLQQPRSPVCLNRQSHTDTISYCQAGQQSRLCERKFDGYDQQGYFALLAVFVRGML